MSGREESGNPPISDDTRRPCGGSRSTVGGTIGNHRVRTHLGCKKSVLLRGRKGSWGKKRCQISGIFCSSDTQNGLGGTFK